MQRNLEICWSATTALGTDDGCRVPAAKSLPHLCPIRELTQAWISLDDFRNISLELGDVTDYMVDATGPTPE